MIRYFVKQHFLKGLVLLTAGLVIAAIALLVAYYSRKPSDGSLYITEYSSIKFDRVDCQSIDTDFTLEFFPIVLHFQTPDAYASFQAGKGYYSAQMGLQNIETMVLTTGQDSIEIQDPENAQINIQAKTFNWDLKQQATKGSSLVLYS